MIFALAVRFGHCYIQSVHIHPNFFETIIQGTIVKRFFVKRFFHVLALFVMGFGACTKYEPPGSPPETAAFEGSFDSHSFVLIAGRRVLAFTNGIGPVSLIGGETDTTVQFAMSTQVTNPAGPVPATQLASIILIREFQGDTMSFRVQYPENEPRYLYTAQTRFLTPYRLPCVIRAVRGLASASDLGAAVTMSNVSGAKLIRHEGSCNIASGEGNVYGEVNLPVNGLCLITALRGDITLKVPTNTSANVTARASGGTVTHSGLVFSSLNPQPGSLTGRLGAGNGEIRLETGQGNIIIQAWVR